MEILEIVLTIGAWRKGWGAWALLPLVGVFAVGFMLGAIAGLDGVDGPAGRQPELRRLGFLVDVAGVIVLGMMARRGPRSVPVGEQRI